jgi:predicted RNase H-like HicB family nuclease
MKARLLQAIQQLPVQEPIELAAAIGCVSQGDGPGQALSNVQEAIAEHRESLRAHDEPIPPSIEDRANLFQSMIMVTTRAGRSNDE